MCLFNTPIPEPEPLQKPATIADTQVQQARQTSDRATRAAAGAGSTVLNTSPVQTMGIKTLLGL